MNENWQDINGFYIGLTQVNPGWLNIVNFFKITNCVVFVCLFVCLFCCFMSQVNSYGHGGTVISPNHTFFQGKLEQAVNQYFVHIPSLVTVELETPASAVSAVRLASVARHVTYWATRPGKLCGLHFCYYTSMVIGLNCFVFKLMSTLTVVTLNLSFFTHTNSRKVTLDVR